MGQVEMRGGGRGIMREKNNQSFMYTKEENRKKKEKKRGKPKSIKCERKFY